MKFKAFPEYPNNLITAHRHPDASAGAGACAPGLHSYYIYLFYWYVHRVYVLTCLRARPDDGTGCALAAIQPGTGAWA